MQDLNIFVILMNLCPYKWENMPVSLSYRYVESILLTKGYITYADLSLLLTKGYITYADLAKYEMPEKYSNFKKYLKERR